MKRGIRNCTLSVVGLAAAACAGETSDEGIVARVGGYELSVDEVVELLVDEERLAADVGVVESIADLWIDYVLLAEAAAEDSTFVDLELEPIVMRQLRQQMVFQFRDSVIQVDTFVTEGELRATYEAESPEVELRARHIMFQLPLGATQADRDSVRARLQGIRQQIVGGADFASLAQRFSQDPGTARFGGDLGFFGRGDMVAPFENAVLALEPGEVSDVVQTPMGLHLIKLEERRTRGFEEVSTNYRRQVQARMVQEAESVFVAGLVEGAAPAVEDGAVVIVRDFAASPGAQLSGRAARRAVVTWEGGRITVGDLRELLQMEGPGLRDQIAEASDEDVEDFLLGLARRDLLVAAAVSAGLRPPQDSIDALVEDARSQLRDAARSVGLLDLDRAPGEDLEIAVQRAVEEALMDNISGASQIIPLGIVSFQLREGRSTTILDGGVGEVILEVARIRAARQLAPVDGGATPADTVGP